jgi:hypothetical protein
MYAFVLADYQDPNYTTFHTFEDERIWTQLNSLTPKPGQSSWTVPVPEGVLVGREQITEVTLTSGSFTDDYAIQLSDSSATTLIATDPRSGYAALADLGIDDAHTFQGFYF